MDALIYKKISEFNDDYQDIFMIYSLVMFVVLLVVSAWIIKSFYRFVYEERYYMKMLLKLAPVDILLKNKQI